MSKLTLPAEAVEVLGPDLAERLLALAEPVVSYSFGDAPTDSTQSYAGGYPFLPEGQQWPTGDASGETQPLVFLLQVNFAELPAVLPDFPREGLVQWFVDGADDTFGLTWQPEATGREGLCVRYYSAEELKQASPSPTETLPYKDESGEETGPLTATDPKTLVFDSREALPSWGEIYEGSRGEGEEAEVFKLLKNLEDPGEAEVHLEELMMPEFSVGGRPVFVQGDPRWGEARANHPHRLLLQIGSDFDTFMWGDMGTAQLFASPEAVAEGDVSEAWWDWACS